MSWRSWPWIEQGGLPLSVLLIRLFWLWPWLLIVGRWTLPPEMRPILPLWLVALLMLGGALTARLLPADLEKSQRSRYVAAAAGLIAMLLTLWWRMGRMEYALWDVRWISDQAMIITHWNGVLPLSVGVLAITAYLWLRGMLDSAAPNHDDIWRVFAGGFFALVFLLVAGRLDPDGPPDGVTLWIVLFFGVGMAALALAGLRSARGIRNTATNLPANRYWAGSIIALVAVLLAAGLLLALFVTPDGVARTMGWMGRVLGWIANLIGYVLYALVYVVFLVLTPLFNWLESRIGSWFELDPERMQDMQQGLTERTDSYSSVTLPAAVDESLRWVVLVVIMVILGVAFALALRRIRRQSTDDEDELRETILTQALLRDQASSLWQRWRDRLFGGSSQSADPFFSLDGEAPVRRRVRAAYQAFLAAMMAQGNARLPGQSPHQFAQSAPSNTPAPSTAVDRLTSVYVAARYGSDVPAPADAVEAEEAWSEISDQLNAARD